MLKDIVCMHCMCIFVRVFGELTKFSLIVVDLHVSGAVDVLGKAKA